MSGSDIGLTLGSRIQVSLHETAPAAVGTDQGSSVASPVSVLVEPFLLGHCQIFMIVKCQLPAE